MRQNVHTTVSTHVFDCVCVIECVCWWSPCGSFGNLTFPTDHHRYQDWDPANHTDFRRTTWGMASPVEYDVPQCPPGTPTAKCIHTITATFFIPKSARIASINIDDKKSPLMLALEN